MARDTQEVHPGRQRLHDLLFRRPMFLVLYCQDLVRFGTLREEDKLGEVRCWNLHILYVFQVRIILSHPLIPFTDDDPRHLEQMIIPLLILLHRGRPSY